MGIVIIKKLTKIIYICKNCNQEYDKFEEAHSCCPDETL